MTKECSRCHETKPLSDFHVRSDRKIGVQPHCKKCQRERKATYLETEAGISKTKAYSKKQYTEHRQELLDTNKKWRTANAERRKEYLNNYERTRRVRTRENLNKYALKSNNKRYRTDPKYRLSRKMSAALFRSIKSGKNGRHWNDVVGYSIDQLIDRLKSTLPEGVSWDDYYNGKTDLHIDHIIPVSVFNYDSSEQSDFKKCWALDNLRLLSSAENRAKSNRLDVPFQPSLF